MVERLKDRVAIVWDRLMTVNLRGTFLSCRAVPKAMREQDGGSVINISNLVGAAVFLASRESSFITSRALVVGGGVVML